MDAPISMQLGGNKLIMKANGTWGLESSDLGSATFEIERLVEEKETLTNSLSQCLDQIDELQKEVVEVNNMKAVVLEMVSLFYHCVLRASVHRHFPHSFLQLMVERQKRLQAESELEGYKEELRESFRVIVELR